MLIEGFRGRIPGTVGLNGEGNLLVAGAAPDYLNDTVNGKLFCASTQAGVALSLLSATATGLILTNPLGSGVYLAVIDLCVAPTTAPAGISSLYLAANVTPSAAAVVHTTPLTVRNTLIGSGTVSQALVDSAATLPAAPVVIRAIGGGPVATGSVNSAFIRDEIKGQIVLAPGTAVSVQALTTAISAIISISWKEIPVANLV